MAFVTAGDFRKGITAHDSNTAAVITSYRYAVYNSIHSLLSTFQFCISDLYGFLIEITCTITLTRMGTDGTSHKWQCISIQNHFQCFFIFALTG